MTRRTALLSVTQKKGIVDFAKSLCKLDFDIIASAGTAKLLREENVPVTDVAEISGSPPILSHRVVTLSAPIHAGIAADESEEHLADLEKIHAKRIDLVCVDLYALEDAIRRGASEQEIINATDIGGPTLLSNAAKARRIVISIPEDRETVLFWLRNGENNKETVLRELAARADFVVAKYRLLTARYHSAGNYEGILGVKLANCEYGENPWQNDAALYSMGRGDPLGIPRFKVIGGSGPSRNSYAAVSRGLQTITHAAAAFAKNATMLGLTEMPRIAIGLKHGNPCGAAFSFKDPDEAARQMIWGDSRAIFGGTVITNFEITAEIARTLKECDMPRGATRVFGEVIAPSITAEANAILQRQDGKCRCYVNPRLAELDESSLDTERRVTHLRDALLVEQNFTHVPDVGQAGDTTVAFSNAYDDEAALSAHIQANLRSLLFAWAIGATSVSNTITLVKNNRLVANAVGQQDRVGACELAVAKAKSNPAALGIEGCLAYSDSFFPFTDGPKVLADAGISGLFTSSGGKNAAEVIAFCKSRFPFLMLIDDKKGRGFNGHCG